MKQGKILEDFPYTVETAEKRSVFARSASDEAISKKGIASLPLRQAQGGSSQ